jgi:hypothetical protein
MDTAQKIDLFFQAQKIAVHKAVLQINYPDRQANPKSLNLVILKFAILSFTFHHLQTN